MPKVGISIRVGHEEKRGGMMAHSALIDLLEETKGNGMLHDALDESCVDVLAHRCGDLVVGHASLQRST